MRRTIIMKRSYVLLFTHNNNVFIQTLTFMLTFSEED